MITNIWNLIPVLVSKPRLGQKMKKRKKTSIGAEMHAQKLRASKKTYFNKRNCQSRQQNRMQQKVSRLRPLRIYQESQD